MKQKPIFKSEQGRQKILEGYNGFLSGLNTEYEQRFVDTKYGKTYVLEAGSIDNPTVILLHGSVSNSAMWFGDIPFLAKKYHVVSIDIIGEAGNSEPIRFSLENDDYALWLGEVFDGLGLKKVTLIGNSLGGWLALKYACLYPQRVKSVVLIATSGIVGAKLSFVLKSIIYVGKGEKGIVPFYEYVSGTRDIPKEIIEYTKVMIDGFNPRVGGLPTLADEQLSKLNMPVLFMAGENDVTMDASKAAKRLSITAPNVTIDLVKDCGHVIFNQAERIMDFLDKEGGRDKNDKIRQFINSTS